MRVSERQAREWLILREKKTVYARDLADLLSVSRRTILDDIARLSVFYPIETVRGRYTGCIRLSAEYNEKDYLLSVQQMDLLIRVWKSLEEEDAAMMWSIIEVLQIPVS